MMITYRGYGPDNPAGGRLVVIEADGRVVGPLPHHVKHSPDGFSWGYTGSGPAELARSLLIHALDIQRHPDALSGDCDGCWWCDAGWQILPETYQQFKVDVVARFPQDGDWTMARDEVRAWAAAWLSQEGDA